MGKPMYHPCDVILCIDFRQLYSKIHFALESKYKKKNFCAGFCHFCFANTAQTVCKCGPA